MAAHRVASVGELWATLERRREVVYLTVEWSAQERESRKTFDAFVGRIEGDHPGLGVGFSIVGEETEGIGDWFRALRLPGIAATGYGGVVWIEGGVFREVVEYAAAVGVDGLVDRTLRLWGGG